MKKLFIPAFILFMLGAWMSDGFFHVDEHFQLIEFANYKLGKVNASELPWEFEAQMRPSLQVFIAYTVMKVSYWAGLTDPFIIVTTLRFITALLSFYATYLFFKAFQPDVKDHKAVIWFGALLFFLWYTPFLSVRFSSETFSTICILFALAIFRKPAFKRGGWWISVLLGICLGLSFEFRYQMGFMLAGCMLYILIIMRLRWTQVMAIVLGIVIAVAIGTISDYWFYQKWVLSAYNYFYQNLVENKAAGFGVSPFWYYAMNTPLFVFPLFGILIVPCMLIFFYKNPRHIFTWMLIPFLLIHHIIGHKEMRFLFPVAPFLPLILVNVMENRKWLKKLRFLQYPFWALNILALVIMTLKPAYDNMGVFKFIYRHPNHQVYFMAQQPPFRMFIKEIANSPFKPGFDLNMRFYQRDNFYPHPLWNITGMDSVVTQSSQPVYLVVRTIAYEENYQPALQKAGLKQKIVYQTYHSMFRRLNYYNWMSLEDVGVWTIVEVNR